MTLTPDPASDAYEKPVKIIAFLYGAATYVAVWGILIYIVGFVGNFFTPFLNTPVAQVIPLKSIDMGVAEPFWRALAIDLGLLLVLALQHSIMARPFFKDRWTKIVPKHLERSTYVLFAIAALSFLIWQWRPIPTVIWDVDHPVIRIVLSAISVGGWLLVLVATFQVGHWKIFGVTQVMDRIQDRPYTLKPHETPDRVFYEVSWPIAYKGVWHFARHPDFFGFCVAFWVTPTMTAGHLVFAIGLTIYIMFGIFFLERNLKKLYGKPYNDYVESRSKIIPWLTRKS